jgi:uncharacterized protein YjbI with pentapeptide repeats
MAKDDHVARLMKGASSWNAWRRENRKIVPDLSGAILGGMNLSGTLLSRAKLTRANLTAANLSKALLSDADLSMADLSEANLAAAHLEKANLHKANLAGANIAGGVDIGGYANLSEANLSLANLERADLRNVWASKANFYRAELGGANLSEADLRSADLREAGLRGANLRGAFLGQAMLYLADLRGADLSNARLGYALLFGAKLDDANLNGATLHGATLTGASLSGGNLSGAVLALSTLVNANLTDADLTGCRIYGVSAWNLKLERTKQQNLIITQPGEAEITVDNIEVAQFIYLMLHNEKIRGVIDTITSKAVLILGRFTDERKAILDAIREELRKRDYLPILFDFAVPATRDITATVSLLARMARFIIADLTDPSSIPIELEAIVPGLAVPVQPLLEGSSRPYAMFNDYWKYDWVLPVYRYKGLEPLLAALPDKVIGPAEGKVKALAERRRMIEAELTRPQ